VALENGAGQSGTFYTAYVHSKSLNQKQNMHVRVGCWLSAAGL
jgi:hypothetical protein